MDKKTAVLQWLNCLTTFGPVDDLVDLSSGNHFLEFAKTINKVQYQSVEQETEEAALERRYKYIKETINGHFHIDSAQHINFELCKSGSSVHDLVMVVLLLLCAIVNHSVNSVVDQTRLKPLHKLELGIQEYIQECLESILAAEQEKQLFTVLSNMASFAFLGTPKTRFSSSPQVSPSVSPIIRTRIKRGKSKHTMQSPLKVFIESPNFKQQVSIKEKMKEITDLRQRLNSEEIKAIEFENRNKSLMGEMHNRDREIKELKEKINFLNSFRELADEYDLKKTELQEQLNILEKKQKNCTNCKHQENNIKSLEDELFEVKAKNEMVAEKCKNFQAQLEALQKDIIERDSIISGLTIAKSDDFGKIQELCAEINRLNSCNAMYKKDCEENLAMMKTHDPFHTPQRLEGETLEGIIDKKLEEMEAELEKEKAKVKEFEEKVKELQAEHKIKDESNKNLECICMELKTKLNEIENSEICLKEQLNHITSQFNCSVNQVAALESDIDRLNSDSLDKVEQLQGNILQLSEKIERQKIQLDCSKDDCQKLLTEKETSEKQFHQELEQQRKNINNLQLELAEYNEKIVILKQDYQNLKQEMDVKKQKINEVQQENNKAVTELQVLTENYKQLQLEKGKTQDQLSEQLLLHKNAIKDHSNRILEYEEKITTTVKELETTQRENDFNKEKTIELEIERNNISAELESWKNAYQALLIEKERNQKELDEKVKVHEKTIEVCQNKIMENHVELFALNKTYEEIQKERGAEKEAMIKLEEEKNEVIAQLQVAKTINEQLLTEKETSEKLQNEELFLQKMVIEDYETKVTALNENITKLMKDHEEIQERMTSEKESSILLQTEKDSLATQLALSKESYETLLTEKMDHEGKLNEELHLRQKIIHDSEAKIINLNENVTTLTGELGNMQQKLDAEKKTVMQLQTERTKMTTEIELSNQNYQCLVTEKADAEKQLSQELNLHKKSIQDYELKIAELDQNILKSKESYETIQQEMVSEKEKVIQLRIEKEKAITQLALAKESYEKKLMEKETIVEKLNEELNCQNKSIEGMEIKIVEFKGEIIRLKDGFESAEQVIGIEKKIKIQLQNEKASILSEVDHLQERCEKLLIDKVATEGKLNEELNLQKKCIDDCEIKIAELGREISVLKKEYQSLQQEHDVQNQREICLVNKKNEVANELELLNQNYQKSSIENDAVQRRLNEELLLLKNSIDDYESKTSELDKQITTFKEEIGSVQQERNAEKEAVIQLQNEKASILSEVDHLQERCEKLLMDKEATERKLNEELNLQKKSIDDCEIKISVLGKEISVLKKECQSLQQERDVQNEREICLVNKKNEIANELELLNQNHQKSLIEKEVVKRQLNDELLLHKKSIDDYESKTSELDKQITTFKEEMGSVQQERNAEKEAVIQLQNVKASILSEVDHLQERCEKLLIDKEATERKLNEEFNLQKKSIDNCETRISELNNEIAMLKEECQNLKQKLDLQNEKEICLVNEKNEAANELKLLNQNHQSSLIEKDLVEKQLNEKLLLQKKTIEEFEDRISELDKQVMTLKEEKGDVQQERNAEKEAVVQLQNEKASVLSEVDHLQERCEKLLKDKEATERKLNKELNLQKKSIDDCETKIAELGREISVLKKECQSLQQERDVQNEREICLVNEKNEIANQLELLNQNYQKSLIEKEAAKRQLNEESLLHKKSIGDYESKTSELDKQIMTFKEEMGSVQQERNAEKEAVIQLQNEKASILSEVDHLQERCEKLLMDKEATERKLNEELNLQKKSIDDCEIKISVLGKEISVLKKECQSLQQEHDLQNEREICLVNEKNEIANELELLNQKSLIEKEAAKRQLNEESLLHKKSIGDYESKTSELDKQIMTFKEEMGSVQQERNAEKEAVIQLQNEKASILSEVDHLQERCEKLLIDKEATERKLNEEFNLQKKSIEISETRISELNNEIAMLKEECQNLQQKLDLQNEKEICLVNEKNEAANELKLLNQNHQSTLIEKDLVEKQLNEKLLLQKKTIEDFEDRISELDKQVMTLKEEQGNVQQERDVEKVAAIQLQTEKAKVITELELLNENYQQLETKKNKIATELELFKENYEKLVTEKETNERNLNQELNRQKESIENYGSKIIEFDRKIVALKKEQESLQGEKNAEKETVVQLQNEKNEIISKLELLNQNYQKLSTEAATIEKQLNEKLQLQEKSIEDYKTKIAEHDGKIIAMVKEQKISEQQNEINKDTISHLARSKTDVSIQLEILKANYENLISETEETKKQLNGELHELKHNLEDCISQIAERDETITALQTIHGKSANSAHDPPSTLLNDGKKNQLTHNLVTFRKKSLKTKVTCEKVCAQAKQQENLLKKATDTMKNHDGRNQVLKADSMKIQEGLDGAQLDSEEKENTPSKLKCKPVITTPDIADVAKNKKVTALHKEEIENLIKEKQDVQKQLDASLKNAKWNKEKTDSEIRKLQKQIDEYKKIAETTTSDVKMMGEKFKNITKKEDMEKQQLDIVSAKYKKAKEVIERLNKEKKELAKKLDAVMEKLRYLEKNNNVEAYRKSNEESQALRKELEETKKSNDPLKDRIKELENARFIQEQTCKSLERGLKLAQSQLARLRKAAEQRDNQSQRLSISSCSPSSVTTPLIQKSKREAHFEKYVHVREKVTKVVDESFLMPIPFESHLNQSFTSSTSEGLNKSVLGAGNLFQCADEEDYLNHSSLENLSFAVPLSATKRLGELQRRNTLCPPHMRSSYAVEMQMQSPSKYSDEALKRGNAVKKVSPKRKRSSSQDESQKSDKESKVVLEKKKKKSRNPFLAANPEKFPWQGNKKPSTQNKTPTTVRRLMKNIKGLSSPKVSLGDSYWPFKS